MRAKPGSMPQPSSAGSPDIPDSWRKWFEFNTEDDAQREAMLEAAVELGRGIRDDKKPKWLSLLGSSGAGKSHIARRLRRVALERVSRHNTRVKVFERGIGPLWASWYSWPIISAGFREGAYSVIDEISAEWFVVLDDIGADHDPSGVGNRSLYRILDERIGKWTVLTSNLSLESLAEINSRIPSRMHRNDSIIVNVDLPDWSTLKR